jgi:hypothetical protein
MQKKHYTEKRVMVKLTVDPAVAAERHAPGAQHDEPRFCPAIGYVVDGRECLGVGPVFAFRLRAFLLVRLSNPFRTAAATPGGL